METSGSNLTNGTIQIGDVQADDRLRVGGILYLEEKLDKSFEEIADDLSQMLDGEKVMLSKMVRGMTPILVALIYQRNMDMTEDELLGVERKIMRFELEEFTALFDKVKLFGPAKNEPAPTPAKTRTRKQVARKSKA